MAILLGFAAFLALGIIIMPTPVTHSDKVWRLVGAAVVGALVAAAMLSR